MARKYRLATLGCKVNQYESQLIRDTLRSLGLQPARRRDVADFAIVNTCAVTSQAFRKSRQAIRRLSQGGQTSVIVVGCGASADAQRLRSITGVTAVLGHDTDVCTELIHLIRQQAIQAPTFEKDTPARATVATPIFPNADRYEVRMNPLHRLVPVSPTISSHESADTESDSPTKIIPPGLPIVNTPDTLTGRIDQFDGHQRAFLKVQDGCDAYCSYCIIPQLRPRLGSKPIEVAVAEARALVAAGHAEIVVTGIFLGAYGRETAIRKRFSGTTSPLAGLIEALAEVAGLKRLRLSSLEPGDVDASLLDVLAKHDNCVPHLHLPLQSGSQNILRRMNRQYTRDDFIDMIDRVQKVLENPAITTDIIVGFPGEAEDDFQASLEVARYAGFLKIHAFPFSSRAGTAAARWQKDSVPKPVVRKRMNRLADLERELSLAYRQPLVGTIERVLVESEVEFAPQVDGDKWEAIECTDQRNNKHQEFVCDVSQTRLFRGRSDRYFDVYIEAEAVSPGELINVRIDRITPLRTYGILIPHNAFTYALPTLT